MRTILLNIKYYMNIFINLTYQIKTFIQMITRSSVYLFNDLVIMDQNKTI